MAVALGLLRDCSPPIELFDFPLYFPKPVFRDRPNPMARMAESEEQVIGYSAQQSVLEEQAKVREAQLAAEEEMKKAAPKPNVQKKKFEEISGGKSSMPAASAGDLARRLGFAPSQADIAELHAQHGDDITLEKFQKWSLDKCAPHKKSDTPDELTLFFKDFDPSGSGVLTRNQVKTILSSYGEALTDQEVDTIFKELNISGDTVDYNVFVDKLLEPEPELS